MLHSPKADGGVKNRRKHPSIPKGGAGKRQGRKRSQTSKGGTGKRQGRKRSQTSKGGTGKRRQQTLARKGSRWIKNLLVPLVIFAGAPLDQTSVVFIHFLLVLESLSRWWDKQP